MGSWLNADPDSDPDKTASFHRISFKVNDAVTKVPGPSRNPGPDYRLIYSYIKIAKHFVCRSQKNFDSLENNFISSAALLP
jgi:hypothetical protein